MKPEQERDQGRWSAPEYVKVESIVVEHGRLPIDEGVVKDIMATIGSGDASALPPIHLWRRQPNADPTLVAGRNRLEAHKSSGQEFITARVITGEMPEIIRAVQLVEIDENLNRRELSPALRLSLTKRRKALYEEEHPETKRGSAGGRAKAGRSAKSQNATEQPPTFIDAHAKQTGRHRATVARELSEAEKIGDAAMKKIVGTSLDKQSEITALAAMDEPERQEIVDRAVAGEKVSAAKLSHDCATRGGPGQSDCNYPEVPNVDLGRDDTLEVKDDETPLQVRDPDGAAPDAYTRWLSQYEAVKARQAALAQEQDDVCRRYIDLRCRIEELDREACRVNEAKPALSGDDCRLLGDTDSVARAAGLSIMKGLELPACTRDAGTPPAPSQPVATQVATNMAAVPAPHTSPEQVAARHVALLRQDIELLNGPQVGFLPSSERLKAPHQLVRVQNTSPVQTHIVIDRQQNGHELRPGEIKEVDMLVDDIASLRELARPNRGFYTHGHLFGRPLPQHPLRFVDLPTPALARVDDGGGGDGHPLKPPVMPGENGATETKPGRK
jgi:hypothetical protein